MKRSEKISSLNFFTAVKKLNEAQATQLAGAQASRLQRGVNRVKRVSLSTRAVIFVLLLASSFSALSCHRPHDAFTLALDAAPETLDPLRGTDAASERLRQLMFNSLVKKDEHFDYVGELARDIKTSDDGLSVTFTLQDNVKFHDGRPLTSADAKYTLDYLLASDSRKAAPFFYDEGERKHLPFVSSIEAPDARTLVIRLNRRWLELLSNLVAVAIIPQGSAEQQRTKPLGSGAFRFLARDESQGIVDMAAFAEYWEGAPAIKRLRVRVILDANTLQAEIRTGRIDMAINYSGLSADTYKALAQLKNLQVVSSPGANVAYLAFQTESPPLNDARVRRAIAYAIDRQAIIHYLYNDQARLAHSILPPESWAYSEGVTYNYDPAKARQILAEAGYGDKSNFKAPLSFKVSSSNTVARQYAGVMQNELAQVGIPVDIQTLENVTLFDAQRKGQYQISTATWVGGNQDPIFLRDLFTRLAGTLFNRTRYHSPEVDKLLSEAVQTADRARAKELYAQAQDAISRDMPMLPLWYFDNMVVVRRGVGNIKIEASGDWRFVRSLTLD
jgi:peptide/nickel transport system substrate-binding protein